MCYVILLCIPQTSALPLAHCKVSPTLHTSMARKGEQEHLLRYQSFHVDKSQPLGHGSYGAVYKARCDQLPCAAKVLHPTILDPRDPGSDRIMKKFRQECAFLNSIRHPHIVMFLGMTLDPESKLPVLLMELLDESLTKMLEHSQQPLAYHVQVDLCHDIALAIAYLHSNDIIHRDLSSNNVLIIAGRRAKVTDFGMSKLISNATSTMTPLTMCPGTQAYMPPETLKEPPTYTKKLDCFSEGVIMIQVCTRQWPNPGPRTHNVSYPNSPTGSIEMPVLETERRKKHIELIDPAHPFLPIAIDCLSYGGEDRPSAEELCQRLADFKETTKYRKSILVFQAESGKTSADNLKQQIRELQLVERSREEYLQREIQKLRKENQKLIQNDDHNRKGTRGEQQQDGRTKTRKLRQQTSLDTVSIELDNSLPEPQLLSLQTGLRSSRSLGQLNSTEHQLSPTSNTHWLSHSPLHQSSKYRHPPSRPPPPSPKSVQRRRFSDQLSCVERMTQSLGFCKLVLKWRDGGRAPSPLCRGGAVVHNDVVYVIGSCNKIYSYNCLTEKWSNLPDCPQQGSCLAIVNGLLTAIGGTVNYKRPSSKLVSLKEEHKRRSLTWMECLPAMPTERWNATAITTEKNKYVIVVGGERSRNKLLDRVEVLNTKTLVWSIATSLPHPCTRASVAICGDRVYVLGGENIDGRTQMVLTCSLTKLLQFSTQVGKPATWQSIADAPAYYSTCTAVDGELLAVGGQDIERRNLATVYKYSPMLNSWNFESNMPTARYQIITTVITRATTNELMVIGGRTHEGTKINIVDIAILN